MKNFNLFYLVLSFVLVGFNYSFSQYCCDAPTIDDIEITSNSPSEITVCVTELLCTNAHYHFCITPVGGTATCYFSYNYCLDIAIDECVDYEINVQYASLECSHTAYSDIVLFEGELYIPLVCYVEDHGTSQTMETDEYTFCEGDVIDLYLAGPNNSPFPYNDYTFDWSIPNSSPPGEPWKVTGITSAGTYAVTITDDTGCETVRRFFIDSEVCCCEDLVFSITHEDHCGTVSICVDEDCHESAFIFSYFPFGGNSNNPDVEESNGRCHTFYNVPPGLYTLKVSTIGTETCPAISAEQSCLVTNTTPDVSFNILNHCEGDDPTVTVSVSGGVAPFSFEWSNGATGNPITVSESATCSSENNNVYTYSVTVTDANGCTVVASDNFRVYVIPQVEVITEDENCETGMGKICFVFPTSCTNRTHIEFNLGDGQGFRKRVPIIDGMACYDVEPGDYNLTVRWGNNQCPTELGSVTIEECCEGPELSCVVTLQDGSAPESSCEYTMCEGDSIVLTLSENPFSPYNYTYQWSANTPVGTDPYTPGWNSQLWFTFPIYDAGTYSVTITDENACTSVNTFTISIGDCCEVPVNPDFGFELSFTTECRIRALFEDFYNVCETDCCSTGIQELTVAFSIYINGEAVSIHSETWYPEENNIPFCRFPIGLIFPSWNYCSLNLEPGDKVIMVLELSEVVTDCSFENSPEGTYTSPPFIITEEHAAACECSEEIPTWNDGDNQMIIIDGGEEDYTPFVQYDDPNIEAVQDNSRGGSSENNLTNSFEIDKAKSTTSRISAFPNPFDQTFNLFLTSTINEEYEWILFDVNGKRVKAITGSIQKGENTIAINGLENLSTGIYYYQLKSNTLFSSGKMIKE